MAKERIERPARSERNRPERLVHNASVATTQRQFAGAIALISEVLSETGPSKVPQLLDLQMPGDKRKLKNLTVEELIAMSDMVDSETDRLVQEGYDPAPRT
jgi:hypothetical protein